MKYCRGKLISRKIACLNSVKNFYKTLSVAGLEVLRAQHLTQLQKIEEDAHGLLQELAVRQGATPAHVKSQLG